MNSERVNGILLKVVLTMSSIAVVLFGVFMINIS